MAQNVTVAGASYSDVPSVDLPKTGGGTSSFFDVSDTTATAADVAQGTYFYTAAGVRTEGTSTGGGITVVETPAPGGGTVVDITGTVVRLQTKTATPSTSAQSVVPDEGYTGMTRVDISAMPTGTEGTPTATKGAVSNHSVTVTPSVTNAAGYISGGTKTGTGVSVSASELVSGSETKTANGTYDVTNLAQLIVNVSGGGGKNTQAYSGMAYSHVGSYIATGVKLTVAKAGTYKVSWMGFRNTNSGTNGSQVYVNGTAKGSAHTSFTSTYGQYCEESLTLAANDVVEVWARARSTTYYMYVGNLVIIEQ